LKQKIGAFGVRNNPILSPGDELVRHGLRQDLLDSILRRPIGERRDGNCVSSLWKGIRPTHNAIAATTCG
jgi:hypothetical protein